MQTQLTFCVQKQEFLCPKYFGSNLIFLMKTQKSRFQKFSSKTKTKNQFLESFFFLGYYLGKFQLPPTKSLLKVQMKRLTKLRLHSINLDWKYEWHFSKYLYIPQFHLGIGIDPWDQILVILVQEFHWDQEVSQLGNQ